jgi:hypothetical protein
MNRRGGMVPWYEGAKVWRCDSSKSNVKSEVGRVFKTKDYLYDIVLSSILLI